MATKDKKENPMTSSGQTLLSPNLNSANLLRPPSPRLRPQSPRQVTMVTVEDKGCLSPVETLYTCILIYYDFYCGRGIFYDAVYSRYILPITHKRRPIARP